MRWKIYDADTCELLDEVDLRRDGWNIGTPQAPPKVVISITAFRRGRA